MSLNMIMTALVAELAADGVPAPLHQSFTLAAVWQDLARLAGEPLPADVCAVLDRPIDYVPVAGPFSPIGESTPIYAD